MNSSNENIELYNTFFKEYKELMYRWGAELVKAESGKYAFYIQGSSEGMWIKDPFYIDAARLHNVLPQFYQEPK